MLFRLSEFLSTQVWGPFRLLSSYLLMMGVGALLAAFLTWWILPKVWGRFLPHDRGKQLVDGKKQVSKGKPTGAGFAFTLIILPVILLLVPLNAWEYGALASLYGSMLFGFFDDASKNPWGELKKGLLDLLVCVAAAYCLYQSHGADVWVPFFKGQWTVPGPLYVAGAAFLLWISTNATNCSDGVDGLAGTLTLCSLSSLVVLLYLVVGYAPVSEYLLIPHNPFAARWALLAVIVAGAIVAYLWYNAEPSKVLMGDAGSRFLGMLIGLLVLISGNVFLIFVVAPVILVNGATGLVKLVVLRLFKKMGFDVQPVTCKKLSAEERASLAEAQRIQIEEELRREQERARRQNVVVKTLHKVRFPIHDHCRKNLHWSNAMVLLRFVLVQAFLTPILFIIFVKLR